MNRTTTGFAILLLVAAAAGCTNEPAELRGPELRVVTFNAGLAFGDVDYTDERVPHVVDAVARLEADVVCLQEVWREEDFAAVRDASAERFPTAIRHAPMPAESSCSEEELAPLAACAAEMCEGLEGEELSGCALGQCDAAFVDISSGCITCMLGVIDAGGGLEAIMGECAGLGGGVGYLYEGAFDTALLTNQPVVESESLVLDSATVRAAVDYALIDGPGGEVHVFCTHLASAINELPYDGEHGDWKGEQARQIDQLLGMIEEKTGGEGRVLVLGDLNSGPAVPGTEIVAKWPDHYERFGDAGLECPYAMQDDAACTSCPDNSFHSPGSDAKLIDHVLVRGTGGGARGELLFTDRIQVEVAGELTAMHLSDHYGLQMTLTY